jgi:hypothetical protein
MSDQIKLILSYRKPGAEWTWESYTPIESVDGIVSITQKYNWEREVFRDYEWKLEAGYLAPNGATTQCATVSHRTGEV